MKIIVDSTVILANEKLHSFYMNNATFNRVSRLLFEGVEPAELLALFASMCNVIDDQNEEIVKYIERFGAIKQ